MRSTCEPSRSNRQSGQALVETAFVIPMMVFFVLGIIQLSLVHHARLMTEYGAYRAVRSGIVNHGDCAIMKKAALTSLLPTLGPLSGSNGRVDTLPRAMAHHALFTQADVSGDYYQAGPLPLLKVEVVNPKRSELDGLFATYGSHMQGMEIDYDDVRDDRVIEANLLSVRLVYFYELRVPFANWQLHSFYMGREYLDDLKGLQFEIQRAGGRSATQYLVERGAARDRTHRGLANLSREGRYIIPLTATWTMRMQSNLFNNGRRGPAQCAVDA
ncbi:MULTISPECIES: TadE/TadG family type IV pilus assembly protein [Myxococcus]|uniref:TadE/TadG family type IV pilus assembly protein n=1 Tax=Myxococcus TaxID=32 RepID=UPI0013D39C30|nr:MULTISPECIES: TadE family protein [Myxococcus]NVJ26837.1 pilus assembly protein [Myxococcus sp. AM011]